ncbi:MAG TPA: MFS transporter [Baekduia sp.]|nr:MFS transporter [Baekduia sp.]HMJ35358.1 MFS transporter [Baekduia sp.]
MTRSHEHVASASIRSAQLSFGAVWASESAFMVGLAVVAFRDGGVTAVGIVTAARMAAAALLAPWLATVADRVRRERVLTGVGLIRAAALGGAAAVTAAGGPTAVTYVLAVVATVALALFRPAHSALLPALCTSPQQLTRANAVRGLLDSSATLGGPAAAAVLLAVSGPAAVFGACAGASLLGGLVVVGLSYDAPPRPETAAGAGPRVLQGFTTIAANRGLALITGLGLVQTFTRGCLTVLTVVVAIDLLKTGDPGVGVLTAAVGAGGMLGSLLAFGLVGRGRLALWFGVGVALFGAPLVLVGAVPEQAPTIVLLGVVGIGNALIDVGGFTLLARLADETVLARMFAGFEAILTLGVAAGSLVTPLVVELLGVRPALVAIGLLAPLAVAAGRPALRRLDADMRVRDTDIEAMRAIRMLGALPVATIEQLAGALEHAEVDPGHTMFRQGERGEYFYVVRSGRVDVLQDGHVVRTLGAGECFGEIALLHDQPRTATVRAAGDTRLHVSRLRRSAYLTAVTGYPAAAAAGDELVTSRLEADAERLLRADERSVPGGDAARAPEAEHVRQPAAGDVDGPPEPLEPAWIRQRGE